MDLKGPTELDSTVETMWIKPAGLAQPRKERSAREWGHRKQAERRDGHADGLNAMGTVSATMR